MVSPFHETITYGKWKASEVCVWQCKDTQAHIGSVVKQSECFGGIPYHQDVASADALLL